MIENALFNGTIVIPCNKSRTDMVEELITGFGENDRLYSYFVRNHTERYDVKYMVSQVDRYNTITIEDAAVEIVKLIEQNNGKDVLGYRQPPIDILVEVLEPMVKKLAKRQNDAWRHLEYEDLCQMCYMVIVELYNKGYYIHKSLVERVLSNYVLLQLRCERNKPVIIPLHQSYKDGGEDGEKITIGDTLMDTSYEEEQVRCDYKEFISRTFDEVKEIVIDLVGPRQFDQLFRDYAHKHTTAQTRKMMQKVKTHLALLGITLEDFVNKYYG